MIASNVSTGKPKTTGAIFRAPIGTTLPTDASTALAEEFKELGYVSEDGVRNTNTAETEDVKAWGGDPVLNLQTGKPDNWKFKLLESLNPEVLKTVYGDANVTVDASGKTITVKATSEQAKDTVYVIDMVMKNGAMKRVVIPIGSLGEVAEIVYKDNEAVGYEITVKALGNKGTTHYEYILLSADNTAAAAASVEGE